MNMKIEIRTIHKIPTSPLKAVANVILDDCFIIRNVRVIETDKSRFISMPSNKMPNGEHRSICHPIDAEFNKMLTAAVLEAYDNA